MPVLSSSLPLPPLPPLLLSAEHAPAKHLAISSTTTRLRPRPLAIMLPMYMYSIYYSCIMYCCTTAATMAILIMPGAIRRGSTMHCVK